MMGANKDNYSTAFPSGLHNTHYGLTKREYFAIQALAPAAYIWRGSEPEKAAWYAVKLADALSAELSK